MIASDNKDIKRIYNVIFGSTIISAIFFALTYVLLFSFLLSFGISVIMFFYGIVQAVTEKKVGIFFYALLPGVMSLLSFMVALDSLCYNNCMTDDNTQFWVGTIGIPAIASVVALIIKIIAIKHAK
jgi:hypothetical protein